MSSSLPQPQQVQTPDPAQAKPGPVSEAEAFLRLFGAAAGQDGR